MSFSNPTLKQVLTAVPMLQWRRCWECHGIALYRDNMLPACKCRACGSADTRQMVKESKLLREDEGGEE